MADIDWDKELEKLIPSVNPYPLKITFDYKDNVGLIAVQIRNLDDLLHNFNVSLENEEEVKRFILNVFKIILVFMEVKDE